MLSGDGPPHLNRDSSTLNDESSQAAGGFQTQRESSSPEEELLPRGRAPPQRKSSSPEGELLPRGRAPPQRESSSPEGEAFIGNAYCLVFFLKPFSVTKCQF
ncbi:hypothetical protein EYF80_034768 [Liparis tanakae]|uniref:Uncharacterized protein n=1 Tax=Liparis tanakae TaxID=230148 RepID=A0A4Z2GNX0_9TELE|nr:hypothetical protein EYF80_034768 [Liparis tanakae]